MIRYAGMPCFYMTATSARGEGRHVQNGLLCMKALCSQALTALVRYFIVWCLLRAVGYCRGLKNYQFSGPIFIMQLRTVSSTSDILEHDICLDQSI